MILWVGRETSDESQLPLFKARQRLERTQSADGQVFQENARQRLEKTHKGLLILDDLQQLDEAPQPRKRFTGRPNPRKWFGK